MRKSIAVLALAAVASLSLSACFVGPHQFGRSVDDWDRDLYVNSPWWNAALWLVPVIPLGYTLAIVGDFLVTDAYSFWLDDAWDGAGTGFEHLKVESPDGQMRSLLTEGSGWLQTHR